MASAQEKEFTISDIYNLPEGIRAELIDGQIYYMAPPSVRHQRLIGKIYTQISIYINSKKGDCEPFISPFAVFLNENEKTYVEPDISVICDKNKLTEKGCKGAPDWVIEIVSPSSKRMDYLVKLFKYRIAGVREYWIVDPAKNTVFAYVFDEEKEDFGEYCFVDEIPVSIYNGELKIKIE